jgi:hypothetical protein
MTLALTFITMIGLGLTGSLHCAVMCGPLCMAMPMHAADKRKMILNSSIYHVGRVLSYALLGVIIGLAGQALIFMKLQSIFLLITGLVFLILGLNLIFKNTVSLRLSGSTFQSKYIKHGYNYFLKKRGMLPIFFLGMLNGLIPCGLVYSAMALSFQGFTITKTALVMVAFGLGTLPMMITLTAGVKIAGFQSKYISTRVTPYLYIAVSALMIYTSINMRLPQQVNLWETLNFPIMCH